MTEVPVDEDQPQILLNLTDRVHSGVPADVFHPPGTDRAYKIFKRYPRDRNAAAVTAAFRSEIAAFGAMIQHEDLRTFVPEPFCEDSVSGVVDSSQDDASPAYHLNYCYSLAWVEGEAVPATEILKFDWGRRLESRMEALGIECWMDGSVFLNPEGDGGKLIDIATQDVGAIYNWVFTAE